MLGVGKMFINVVLDWCQVDKKYYLCGMKSDWFYVGMKYEGGEIIVTKSMVALGKYYGVTARTIKRWIEKGECRKGKIYYSNVTKMNYGRKSF